MPRTWRLSRHAEASLVEIARWTQDNFGSRQAGAYEEEVIERCAAIAAGTCFSQSCRLVLDEELPEDLRFTRCGQHLVVFIAEPDSVMIVDILHSRSDFLGKLRWLAGRVKKTGQ